MALVPALLSAKAALPDACSNEEDATELVLQTSPALLADCLHLMMQTGRKAVLSTNVDLLHSFKLQCPGHRTTPWPGHLQYKQRPLSVERHGQYVCLSRFGVTSRTGGQLVTLSRFPLDTLKVSGGPRVYSRHAKNQCSIYCMLPRGMPENLDRCKGQRRYYPSILCLIV